MAYTPPSWNAVDFGATTNAYTPPVWNDIDFPVKLDLRILTGSTINFVGYTPIAPAELIRTVGSTVLLNTIGVGWVPGDAWPSPWTNSGSSVNWLSSYERQSNFTCATASSVSWSARFQYVSELVSTAGSATDWRSSFSVVPHNVLKQGSIDLNLKSVAAWKSRFAAPAEFIRDNASKTTLAFIAGFEKPTAFSMKPGSIASWKGRFHYLSTFSMPPATSIVWRSSSSGYSNPCCMQPVACRIPVYATAARFVVTCKSRLCLRS